jgi:FMNH2-dependent dimethyl sulfone monooxygenase
VTSSDFIAKDNALANANRLKLGTFALNCKGGVSITTIPGTLEADWPQVAKVANTVDRLGFEVFVPIARWKGFGGKTDFNGANFDPFTWAAGLAGVTENAVIFSTVHVPIHHPIAAAKMISTIDHISGGRAGVNVVGGWYTPELEMFGRAQLEHDRRYDVAAEWTTLVRDLWTRDDEFDYSGEFFEVRQAYSQPKPLQKPRPPIMNAGGSSRGRRYAAEYADLAYILIKEDDAGAAREQVQSIKRMAREEFGREISVWTFGFVSCASTEAEAREYVRWFADEHGDTEAADRVMKFIGLETGALGKDTYEAYRHRFIAGGGGIELVGTPEQIVDRLQYVVETGCDGCLLSWPEWEKGLAQFEREVMPLLEQVGLREPYVPAPIGATL